MDRGLVRFPLIADLSLAALALRVLLLLIAKCHFLHELPNRLVLRSTKKFSAPMLFSRSPSD
jgi:hypothetical protein